MNLSFFFFSFFLFFFVCLQLNQPQLCVSSCDLQEEP